jgi:dihydroflavonol-4-reductase
VRVLVTGASGFLGSHLVTQLLAAGHEVRAAHRPGDPTELLDGLGVETDAFDLLDREAVLRAAAGAEAIFHAAALVTFRRERYDEQMRVNVEGTRAILAAARAAGVRRLVYTSTVSVLGIPEEGSIGDEGTAFNWGRYRLGYMDSKRAAEALVLEAAASGLDAVCLLPGTFFGPGDIAFNAGEYIRQASLGRLLAYPAGGTNVVHVGDVARGHLLALERGRRGERYILGGENLTYRDLFSMIAEEVGVRPPRIPLLRRLLLGLGRAAETAGRLSGSRLAVPFDEGLAVAASSRLFYSSAKAERELGYASRPAREAIRDAVRWYRERALV